MKNRMHYFPIVICLALTLLCASAITARQLIERASEFRVASLQERNYTLQALILKKKELIDYLNESDLRTFMKQAIFQEAMIILASGGTGGFFEKLPPLTPQKTFVNPTTWGGVKDK